MQILLVFFSCGEIELTPLFQFLMLPDLGRFLHVMLQNTWHLQTFGCEDKKMNLKSAGSSMFGCQEMHDVWLLAYL